MNYLGRLCRELEGDMGLTQRQLARRLGISLGKCNTLTRMAEEQGLVSVLPGARGLTGKGRRYLEQFRVKNAVILAAGIDVRFVPFTHEVPKCMMQVEEQRIIERVICQLREAGIEDITIVVGYLAEMFDYLIDKYGVKLLFNPEYATKNNLASLYLARHLLGNTMLVSADLWMWENVFHIYEPEAWCACHWHEGATDRWCLVTNGKRQVRRVRRGGRDMLAMLGPVHMDERFSREVAARLEEAYHQPGNDDAPWQSVLGHGMEQMGLSANILPPGIVQDFATFEELRDFDTTYVEYSGNKNLRKIASIFEVPESRIEGLTWMDVGMTNQTFRFTLDGQGYIYRIPGQGTENFISRRQEAEVYAAIRELDIADEVLYLDGDTGIKIARYYPNSHNVAPDDGPAIKTCMQILRRLHTAGAKVGHRFDILRKLGEFEAMCREVDCIRFDDFAATKQRVEVALDVIRNTVQPLVLCHGDAAHVNFLTLEDSSIRLLDWEYGGMCHGVADVAMFGLFQNSSFAQIDEMLEWYCGRTPTEEERILCFSYVSASGLLWSMWAEYRQYYGEDFGEYAMLQYRTAKEAVARVQTLLAEAADAPGKPPQDRGAGQEAI
ncbi:phosphotransferase [Ruminococcaceae bacterium OttesenSCG-928-O06]|nr:phosphotransferase [Ruminococcaceae bacterium OttesenSCG-928-O06]